MLGLMRQKSISRPPMCESCVVGRVSERLIKPNWVARDEMLESSFLFCSIVSFASILRIISSLFSIFFN